jgi:hypothetical protein
VISVFNHLGSRLLLRALVFLGLFLFLYHTSFYLYPVHTLILENRVLHWFGLADRISIPIGKESKKRLLYFPTIENFEMVGMEGARKKFLLKGERLEFQDMKLWLVYTPLIKIGKLTKPQFFFYSKEKGEVKCVSSEARIMDQNQHLVLPKDSMCWFDDKLHKVTRVEYKHKLGELRLTPHLSNSIAIR